MAGSVSLTLGDDLQPASPITLTFEIDEETLSEEDWAADAVPVVVTESEDGAVGLLEASRDGEILTAQTGHLSFFQPIQLDFGKVMSQARDLLMQSLGLEMRVPDCVGKSAFASSGIEYKIDYRAAVHPCISADGDKIIVDLYAATMMPYRAKSWPEVVGGTVASPDGEGMLMALADKLVPSASGGVLMGGGASARFEFPASNPPQFVEARQDAHMLIGAVLLQLIGVVLNPLGGGAAFLEKVEQLDCLSGVVNVSTDAQFTESTAADLFRTTLACVGTLGGAASLPIRIALALIGAVPALFAGVAIGLYREFAGKAVERIDVVSSVTPWSITFDGIGPFKVGTSTWDEADAISGFQGTVFDWYEPAVCASGGWFDTGTIYDGVSVLADKPDSANPGTLDVVGVNTWSRTGVAATVPTATYKGVRLGSTEADVRAAYPGVQPVPHRLDEGLLLYRVENGAGRAIVIGVSAGKVQDISVGSIPEVDYIEGCV